MPCSVYRQVGVGALEHTFSGRGRPASGTGNRCSSRGSSSGNRSSTAPSLQDAWTSRTRPTSVTVSARRPGPTVSGDADRAVGLPVGGAGVGAARPSSGVTVRRAARAGRRTCRSRSMACRRVGGTAPGSGGAHRDGRRPRASSSRKGRGRRERGRASPMASGDRTAAIGARCRPGRGRTGRPSTASRPGPYTSTTTARPGRGRRRRALAASAGRRAPGPRRGAGGRRGRRRERRPPQVGGGAGSDPSRSRAMPRKGWASTRSTAAGTASSRSHSASHAAATAVAAGPPGRVRLHARPHPRARRRLRCASASAAMAAVPPPPPASSSNRCPAHVWVTSGEPRPVAGAGPRRPAGTGRRSRPKGCRTAAGR